MTAEELAHEYFRWMDATMPLVSAKRAEDTVTLRAVGIPILRLRRASDFSPRNARYDVVGGAVARGGVFEFREEGAEVIADLVGFRPSYPRFLYLVTQNLIHAATMWLFGRHLRRVG